MNSYPEEILIPPQPWAAVFSDAPFLEPLVASLKMGGLSAGGGGGGSGSLRLRYEPYPLSQIAQLPRRTRSHANEYEVYVPAGLMRSNWMHKHANLIPGLLVLAWPFDARMAPQEWAPRESSLVSAIMALREYGRGRGQDVHVLLVSDASSSNSSAALSAAAGSGGGGGSGVGIGGSVDRRAGGQAGGTETIIFAGSEVGGGAASSSSSSSEALAERVTSVRRRAGLGGNAVTLVPRLGVGSAGGDADGGPGGPGSAALFAALDAALKEKALAYYQSSSRRAKAALQRLRQPQGLQSALRARLLFKQGHLQEYRGRPSKALKYFSLASAALQAMALQAAAAAAAAAAGAPASASAPALPFSVGEVKALADLTNFKLLHGYLQAGLREMTTPAGVVLPGAHAAVIQFNQHMRAFERALGPEDARRPWAHPAWMSRQHLVAAELLQLNLPRPTAETRAAYLPSHYYHSAALFAAKRRAAAEAAGVVPAVRVSMGDGGAGAAGPLFASVAGLEEARAHAASGGGGSAVPSPSLPAVAAALEAASQFALAERLYEGGRPSVVSSAGQPVTSPAALLPALDAFAVLEETRVRHGEIVTQLLEKAQAMSTIDGGPGARVPYGAPASGEAFFARGSNFTFEVAAGASRGRLWRQSLLADEAWSGGQAAQAARLLLPVVERLRCERSWGALCRSLQRLRECAAVSQDTRLYAISTLELLGALSAQMQQPGLPVTSNVGASADVAFAHLAAVLRASAAAPGAKSSGGGGSVGAASAFLTVPMPAPPPLPADSDDSSPGFGRGPGPARTTASLRRVGAPGGPMPLVSALVAFSNRCAQRGRKVRVRVVLTSAFPRPVLCEEVRVSFAHADGDFALRTEGQGADGARPLVSGMRQRAGPSPFDVVLRHGPLPSAGASSDDGITLLLGGAGGPDNNSAVAADSPRVLTLPLILPSRGSIAVEFEVELPGLEDGGSGGSSSSSSLSAAASSTAPLAADAAAPIAARSAAMGGASLSATDGSTALSRWDASCTDPATMAAVLTSSAAAAAAAAGGSAASALPPGIPTAGWDPRAETVLPTRVVVAWKGRGSDADAAPPADSPAMEFDLLPRAFGASAPARIPSGLETTPVAPEPGMQPADAMLACLAQHRMPAAMALAEALPPAVAHLVRTGLGLGASRGAVGVFMPGSGGPGFLDSGELPNSMRAAMKGAAHRHVAVADEATVAEVAARSAAFLVAPGTGLGTAQKPTTADAPGMASSARSSLPAFLSHETDGAACGKPLPYHPMLLALAPDAHVTVAFAGGWDGGKGGDAGAATVATAAAAEAAAAAAAAAAAGEEGADGAGAPAPLPASCITGIPSPVQITVSCGRRGMIGGVVKLAAAAALLSSRSGDGGDGIGGGMADVSLSSVAPADVSSSFAAPAVPASHHQSGPAAGAGATASSSSFADARAEQQQKECGATLWVHPSTLVVLAEGGKQVQAKDSGCPVLAGHSLVALAGPRVAGVALPALPAGVAFTFRAYALVDHAPEADILAAADWGAAGAEGGGGFLSSAAAAGPAPCATVALLAEVHVCEDDGLASGGDGWIAALKAQPTLHRTLAVPAALPAYAPLTVRATVVPDPSSPLLDLGPLILPLHGAQKPWQVAPPGGWGGAGVPLQLHEPSLVAASEGPVFSLLPLVASSSSSSSSSSSVLSSSASAGGSPVVGHVRVGSRWTLAIDIVGNPVAPISISGLELVAPSAGGLRVGTGAADVRKQLGLDLESVGVAAASPAGMSALSAAVARALAAAPRTVRVDCGAALSASMVADALVPGLHSAGSLKVTWTLAGTAAAGAAPGGGAKAKAIAAAAAAAAAAVPGATLSLLLPPVAVHDPSVRCSVSFPSNPKAGERCALALQLANNSAHFHAVEVSASPPAALAPQALLAPGLAAAGRAGGAAGALGAVGARGGAGAAAARPGAAAHVPRPVAGGAPAPPISGVASGIPPSLPPSALPVPAMELVGYGRFIVELLPGAAKTVTFALLPHSPGYAALPVITLRASTGSRAPTGAAPIAAAAGGLGGGDASSAAVVLPPQARLVSPAVDALLVLCAAGGPDGGATARGRGSRPANNSRRGSAANAAAAGGGAGGGASSANSPPIPLTVYVSA